MYNIDQPAIKDVAPLVEAPKESEQNSSTRVSALLENQPNSSMQSQHDSATMVENGMLGKLSIDHDQKPQKMIWLAEAFTPENAPVPITKLPDGPPTRDQRRKPSDGIPIGPGSIQIIRKPGSA